MSYEERLKTLVSISIGGMLIGVFLMSKVVVILSLVLLLIAVNLEEFNE